MLTIPARPVQNSTAGILDKQQLHLPQAAFPGAGSCYKDREIGVEVNTVVVHSCYVLPELCTAAAYDKPVVQTMAEAVDLANTWRTLTARLKGGDVVENERSRLEAQAQQLEFSAIRLFFQAKGIQPETFSIQAVAALFEFYGVSAHFIIDRTGKIFELVNPDKLAFHAGVSRMPENMGGASYVNGFSVGIELVATEDSGFSDMQYSALFALSNELRSRYPIKYFVGHSDVAPGRKTDPHRFDWGRFKSLMG